MLPIHSGNGVSEIKEIFRSAQKEDLDEAKSRAIRSHNIIIHGVIEKHRSAKTKNIKDAERRRLHLESQRKRILPEVYKARLE